MPGSGNNYLSEKYAIGCWLLKNESNISIIRGGVFVGAGFIPARIAALAAVWAGIKPAPTVTFFRQMEDLKCNKCGPSPPAKFLLLISIHHSNLQYLVLFPLVIIYE